MCEIAILDPDRTSVEELHDVASTFHEGQGDGLGILAVQVADDDTFNYEVYKQAEPHWFSFHNFVKRTKEDTWRYVLHARYQTVGDVNRVNTHPLRMDCEECEGEWVVHNGSVRRHQPTRGGLMSAGHKFSTDVDSEVIGHKLPTLPEGDLGEFRYNEDGLTGNLNYLVFYENGIFARFTQKYGITDDFIAAKTIRKNRKPFSSYTGYKQYKKWFRVTADGDEVVVEGVRQSRNYTSSKTSSPSNSTAVAKSSCSVNNGPTPSAIQGTTIEETYSDLIPSVKGVVAYEVAPGVVKVVLKKKNDHFFVWKNENPKAYDYYINHDTGESSVDPGVQALFDAEGKMKDPGELTDDEKATFAQHLIDHDDERIREVAAEVLEITLESAVEDARWEDEDPLEMLQEYETRAINILARFFGNRHKALNRVQRMDRETIAALAKGDVKLQEALAMTA